MFIYIKKSPVLSSKVSGIRTVSKSSGAAKQDKDESERSPLRPLLLVERVLGIDSISRPSQEPKQVERSGLKQSAPTKDPAPARASLDVEKKTSKVEVKRQSTKPPFKVSFSVPSRTSSYLSRPTSQLSTPTVPKKPVAPFIVLLHFKKPSTSSRVVDTGTIKSAPSKSHFLTPPFATVSKVSKVVEPRLSLPTSLPASKTASRARSSLPVPTPQGTAHESRIPRLRVDKISDNISIPPKVFSPVLSSSNPTSPTTPCPRPAITASKTKALCFPTNVKVPSTVIKASFPKPKSDSPSVPTESKSTDVKKVAEATLPTPKAALVQDAAPVITGTQNLQNSQTHSPVVTTHPNHDVDNALVLELKSVLKKVHVSGAPLDEMTRSVSKESPKVVRRVSFAEKENCTELQKVFRRRSIGGLIAKRTPFSSITSNIESSSGPSSSPEDSSFELVNTPFGTRKIRRIIVSPLEDGAMASRNTQIQLELSALRSQKKVQGGGEKLNCPKEGMSLYSLAIIQKNRKSI